MKKNYPYVLAIIVLLMSAFSIPVLGNENVIEVMEYKVNLQNYAEGGTSIISETIDAREVSSSEPVLEVKDTKQLHERSTFMLPKGNYAYYHHVVDYNDGTVENVFSEEINYKTLTDHADALGKSVSGVRVYYALASKVTINYHLLDENGVSELLLSESAFGRHALIYDGIEIPAKTMDISPIVNDYIVVGATDLSAIDFDTNDKVIDITLRQPIHTFKFLSENGEAIAKEVQLSDCIGTSFEFTAPSLVGYKLKSLLKTQGIYEAKDQAFEIIYAQVDASIDNVDKGETPIKPVLPKHDDAATVASAKTLPRTGETVMESVVGSLGMLLLSVGLLFKNIK